MADHHFTGLALRLTPLIITALLMSGCEVPQSGNASERQLPELSRDALISEQRGWVTAAYEATSDLARATDTFLQNPNPELRDKVQFHWINAHKQYLKAALIQRQPPIFKDIDSWPVNVGFFDSLPNYPESGIISDEKLEIAPTTLRAQHQITADEEVALGYHVLEHYAFERPLGDFETSGSSSPVSKRRTRYVSIAAKLLLKDVTEYREAFEDNPEDLLPQSYPALIHQMHERAQQIFSETNLLGQHSPSAGRSTQDIAVQLQQIRSLLNEPVDLNRYLLMLDPTTTQVFHNTLNEAIELLPNAGPIEEADASRLLLLTAALTHQLEDFQRLLPRQSEI